MRRGYKKGIVVLLMISMIANMSSVSFAETNTVASQEEVVEEVEEEVVEEEVSEQEIVEESEDSIVALTEDITQVMSSGIGSAIAEIDGATYFYNDSEGVITGVESDNDRIEIPSEIEGVPIVGLQYDSFARCDNMTMVEIPTSISAIGENVFTGCELLSSVYYDGGREEWVAIDGYENVTKEYTIYYDNKLYYPSYESHYYYMFLDVCATWEEAQAYCESLGGYLAVINGEDENVMLYDMMEDLGYRNAYFGYYESEDGVWGWVDNDTSTYVNWSSGEPNNSNNNEDYAMFYQGSTQYKWNDGSFGQGTTSDDVAFICEWDCDPNLYINSEEYTGGTYSISVFNSAATQIENATVTIDGEVYYAEESGIVKINNQQESQLIKVEAEGYRESVIECTTIEGGYRSVYLEAAKDDGLPYITMVMETGEEKELRQDSVYYKEDDGTTVEITALANWQGASEGKYVIFQEGESAEEVGVSIEAESGVFSFAPGNIFDCGRPIYMKVVGSDGVESEPIELCITIIENIEGGVPSLGTFEWPEYTPGVIKDSEVTGLFPDTYGALFSDVPYFTTENVDGETGYTTYRITIGVSGDTDEDVVKAFVEDCEAGYNDAVEAKKTIDELSDSMSELGKIVGKADVSTSFEAPELSCVGYLDIIMDIDGNIIGEPKGGLVMTVEGSYTITNQFLAGPVPLYVDLTLNAEAEGASELTYEKDASSFDLTGSITITPGIAVGAGVGVSGLLTFGAEGTADLEIQIVPESTGDITLEASLTAQVVFLFDWSYLIATRTFNLWGEEVTATSATYMSSPLDGVADIESDLEFADRTYTDQTTDWNGGQSLARTIVSDEEIKTLQEWVMPSTMPELVEVDGTKIMLFHTDMADEETGNNIRIVYSIYDEVTKSWSEPESLTEQSTSDMYFKIYEDDGELYVVSQKCSEKLESTEVEDMLVEVGTIVDVNISKWNGETNTFDSEYVNNDAMLDMYATVAVDGEQKTAVWVTNSDNEVLGSGGVYSIMSSDYVDGAWTAPESLYETSMYISEMEACYCNGNLEIVFALELDTVTGNIYTIIDGNAMMICAQDTSGQAIKVADGQFYWTADGIVNVYDPSVGIVEEINAGENSTILSSYRIVENDNTTAIVWLGKESIEDSEELESVIYASVQVESGWSEPIVLKSVEDYSIEFMDVELNDDGTWSLVMNQLEDEKTSIVYEVIESKVDVELNYVSSGEIVGCEQNITLSIENLGQETVEEISVEVLDEEGNIYYDNIVDVEIETGNRELSDITIDVSDIENEKELTVTVQVDEETALSDNKQQIKIGGVDVSLEVSREIVGDRIVFSVAVQNAYSTESDVELIIRADSSDGEEIERVAISELNNESTYVYRHLVNMDTLDFEGEQQKYFYFQVVSDKVDVSSTDNEVMVVVYQTEKSELFNSQLEAIDLVSVSSIETTDYINIEMGTGIENVWTIDADISPTNASNQGIDWSSNNIAVATVSSEGVVQAYSEGNAVITATTKDGGFVSQTTIKVSAEEVDIFEITFDYTIADMISTVETQEDGTVALYPVPVKSGYVFEGWYTSEEEGIPVTEETVFTEDTEVYAVWTKDLSELMGDVDGDECISSADAMLVLQEVAGVISLTESQQAKADVSGDNYIAANDAMIILQHVAGILNIE